MKSSGIWACATALVAGTSAAVLDAHLHGHLHKARDAVASSVLNTVTTSCGCDTVYTTYFGTPTLLVQRAPATVAVVPASTPSTAVVVTAPSSGPAYNAPANNAPAPVAVSSASSTSAAVSGGLGSTGELWAVTYTQYTSSGACKDGGVMITEIANLKKLGFSTVRMYGTDCNGLQNIGAAVRAAGMTMIIGVFIDGSGISGAQSQVTDIINWAQWDLVKLIVCGNEAVFSGHVSASALVSFVASSKTAFAGAGYTGPVSLTETVNIWQANADLFCSVVDKITFNSHAFFNGATTASNAGAFLQTQFDIMDKLCAGKGPSYNIECGWPTAGACNDKACPGFPEQSAAIDSIRAAGLLQKTVLFSYQNDPWKPEADQHWGVMSCFS